jgi:hypothetical protein
VITECEIIFSEYEINVVGSKNIVFWYIFTAVEMKGVVFWNITPCGSSKKLFLVRREAHPRCDLGSLRALYPEDGSDMFLRNVGSY